MTTTGSPTYHDQTGVMLIPLGDGRDVQHPPRLCGHNHGTVEREP